MTARIDRRLLVVSPHFPPSSTADMHRVRMLLPYLEEHGWGVEVLAVSPDQVAAPLDPWLEEGFPPGIPVHRVNAIGLGASRLPGLGTLGMRALPALDAAGNTLLARGHFDLVYFSTTMFEVHMLGPRWQRRHGVPFVMDFQDLWVSDYYREHPDVVPPGGRFKYALASRVHRWMEPRVLARCAGITSVSPEYPRVLGERYPSLTSLRCLVQAFPGSTRDFERLSVPRSSRDPARENWVYVGRGGNDMATALRALFLALRDHATPELRERLRLQFIGTSYAGGQATVMPIAAEYGMESVVEEIPDRVSYSDALARISGADALIVPGSDDPGYTASKIYPYLLARRPMLAVFHELSSVVDVMSKAGGGVCVPFASDEDVAAIAVRIKERWLDVEAYRRPVPLDLEAFEPYGEKRCAAELASFLHRCAGD